MGFIAALEFLTILRWPGRREASSAGLGQSVAFFPLVGLIVGLLLAGLHWVLELVLPLAIVSALLVVFLVIISGGLHIDGFIDTCDGLGGHNRTAAERWRIMDGGQVGAFGVAGAIGLLLTKYVTLTSLPAAGATISLVLAPVMSRWAMAYALAAYPYAKPEGLGRAMKEGATGGRLAAATLLTLLIVTGVAWPLKLNFSLYLAGLALLAVTWLITVLVAAYLKGKFAGLTGDSYGAINEIVEVTALLFFVILGRYNLFLVG